MDNVNSIKILGSGTVPKGEYDLVSIIGEAKGTDEFKVNFLKIIGQLIADGKVSCEDARILGEMICNDACESHNELEILGRLTSNCTYSGNKIKVYGQGFFYDTLEFSDIEILGELVVSKNCKGNVFTSKGKLDLKGILSADKVYINPKGKSYINAIDSDYIRIRNKNLFNFGETFISAEVIHGNKVEIENTNSKLVQGEDVIILDNCNIDRVEYGNSLSVSSNSNVREKVKISHIAIE